MFSRWKQSIKQFRQRNAFTNHVLTLVGWTAITQGLYICVVPVLSRFYSVETFGHLAVLQSVSAFLIVIASLRYEVAILLPADDETAVNVLALALSSVAAITAATVAAALIAAGFHLFRGELAFMRTCWWLIPVLVCGAGGNEALTNWAVRKKAYSIIARTKITQVSSQVFTQMGMALLRLGPMGLYLGDVLGRVGGAGTLLRMVWAQDRKLVRGISLKQMAQAARDYKSFPLYSTWAILLSCSGRNLTPLVLTCLYGPVSAGWYALAARVIAAPLELICRSFSQVYMGEASRLAREDPPALMRLYQNATKKLLLIGTVPSLCLALFAPALFRFAFGAKWHGAGVYACSMSVLLLAQFVHFPLAVTINILSRQRWQLIWDGCNLLLGIGGVVLLHNFGVSDRHAILYYSCSMAAMFVIHYVMCYVAIKQSIASFTASAATPLCLEMSSNSA